MDRFTDAEIEEIERDYPSESSGSGSETKSSGGSGGLPFVSRDNEKDGENLWNDPGDPKRSFWEFSQSKGTMSHVNEKTGRRKLFGRGYSGKGKGLNNPKMQKEKNVGPIPRGSWKIGKPRDGGKRGPSVLDLTPKDGKKYLDRDNFLIHGDNKKGDRSASTGCIIMPCDVRNKIANSGDKELWVTK